jgi:signal transduction histidine kinase
MDRTDTDESATRGQAGDERSRDGDAEGRSEVELVGTVAHDLRGPLARASGWLALAREDGDEEFFDEVEAALEQLAARVEDLVHLACDGTDTGVTEPVSLAETTERVWDDVVVDTPAEGGSLLVEGDRTLVVVPERLERLLANLLRNALVHGREARGAETRVAGEQGRTSQSRETGEGRSRSLTVRVGTLPSGFYVEDDGVGIPEDERERAFAVGYSTDRDGSGLGLASVAQVAAAHGWCVDLTTSDAGGARFEFTGVATPA